MKPLLYKEKPTPGVCAAKSCTNTTDRTLCGTCRSRKYRLADPVRYAYNNLKRSATKRNIPFTITLENFREFCVKVNWIGLARGRHADCYDIDRKYEDVGYHIDNIQMLEKRKNITKFFQYDWRRKQVLIGVIKTEEETEDLPF